MNSFSIDFRYDGKVNKCRAVVEQTRGAPVTEGWVSEPLYKTAEDAMRAGAMWLNNEVLHHRDPGLFYAKVEAALH